jgi:integral membrane sensor domain MASE1
MTSAKVKQPVKVVDIVVVALGSALYAVLAVASIIFRFFPGSTVWWNPSIVIGSFGVWFGIWGVLPGFFGTLLFEPVYGTPLYVAAFYGIANLVEPLIPAVVFKELKLDIGLRDKKSLTAWIISGVIVGPFLAAFLGNLTSAIFGIISWQVAFSFVIFTWWIGVALPELIGGTLLLRYMSPFVSKTSLYVNGLVRRSR